MRRGTKNTKKALNVLFGLVCMLSGALRASAQGNVTQRSTGPCSPNIVGDGNINNCVPPPPPDRMILLGNAKSAIKILAGAPAGSTVQFGFVGESREIDQFSGWVAGLFHEAHWSFMPSARIGHENILNGDTGQETHGEGIECDGISGSAAFEAAKKALKAAGYPCKEGRYWPMPGQKNIPDVYIKIGANSA